MFAAPLIVNADALFDEETEKEIGMMLDSRGCATGCEGKTFDGRAVKAEMVDINGDRVAEYFVTLTDKYGCGSAGCAAAIFMRRSGRWVKLAESFGLTILKTKTRGYSDLMANYGKLSWNGQKYEVVIRPSR